MLGKLFKHDFKSQYRIHCGIYILILISSLAVFGVLKLDEKYPNAKLFDILLGFAIMIFIILAIGVLFVTLIVSVLRYRKNLLKDEGYLMHTLPVPVWSLHLSKMLTALCWYVLDGVVLIAAISIVTGGIKWFQYVESMALLTFGVMPGVQAFDGMTLVTAAQITAEPSEATKMLALIGFLLYIVIGLICGLSQIYVSLAFGYTAYSSKDLMSFVAYIITYIVMQVLSMIGLFIVSLADFGSISAIFGTEELISPSNYFMHIMTFAMILSGVLAVIYNILSVRILKNKLNLE